MRVVVRPYRAVPGVLPGNRLAILVDRFHQGIVDVDIHIPAIGIAGVDHTELCIIESEVRDLTNGV